MTTMELINAAITAKDNLAAAQASGQQAVAAIQQAQEAKDAADQALHDDLDMNGSKAVVNANATPPNVTVYEASDPDSYTATVYEIAA